MISVMQCDEIVEKRIFWASDSTVQTNTFDTWPQTGIGQMFVLFCAPRVQVHNYAKNGASTKSFLDLGLWDKLMHQLQADDFVFLQFGHNDNKPENPERYTSPWQSYTENLCKMARDAQRKGAMPVMITPLARSKFNKDNTLCETHGEYPDAMRTLAAQLQLPCIDLTAHSMQFLTQVGEENARTLHLHFTPGEFDAFPQGASDTTHLSPKGAFVYARLIAQEIVKLKSPYNTLVAQNNVGES